MHTLLTHNLFAVARSLLVLVPLLRILCHLFRIVASAVCFGVTLRFLDLVIKGGGGGGDKGYFFVKLDFEITN